MYENFSFIIDDVLPTEEFDDLQDYAKSASYQTITNTNKKFYLAYPPASLSDKLQKK